MMTRDPYEDEATKSEIEVVNERFMAALLEYARKTGNIGLINTLMKMR